MQRTPHTGATILSTLPPRSFGALTACTTARQDLAEKGFFYGFDGVVVCVILINSIGGARATSCMYVCAHGCARVCRPSRRCHAAPRVMLSSCLTCQTPCCPGVLFCSMFVTCYGCFFSIFVQILAACHCCLVCKAVTTKEWVSSALPRLSPAHRAL